MLDNLLSLNLIILILIFSFVIIIATNVLASLITFALHLFIKIKKL